jgi:phosphoribosylamine-glycine ligase
MKKILVTATRISGSHLAKKLAEDNPDIEIHLVGARLRTILPKNLKYLGEDLKPADNINRVKEIYQNYDFIYAADLPFQLSLDFQNWKNSVDIPILCPTRECGYLEFSKLTSKKMLNQIGIPNADFEIIQEDDWGRIIDLKKEKFINSKFVLKLDRSSMSTGLQTRFSTIDDYKEKIAEYRQMSGNFFIEEFIQGKELSAHFLCNGKSWVYLGSARDYKKLYDNDKGTNCSSTGSYSPIEYITENIKLQMFSYMDRILDYLNNQGIEYKGIMYLGLLIDSENVVNVLEINTRPGNPEFAVILNTIDSKNLLENLYKAYAGENLSPIEFNNKAVVGLNLIHKNYSNFPQLRPKIPELIPNEKFINCYYNGMIYGNNYFMNIINVGTDAETVSNEIYSWLKEKDFGDYRYRSDIGKLI